MLWLKLEGTPGDECEKNVREAAEAATRLGLAVSIDCNGIVVPIVPGTPPDEAAQRYLDQVNARQEAFRRTQHRHT